MDSGIKVEKSTVEMMTEMKETKKNPYDLLILDIVQIPGTAAVGTKTAPEHVVVTKSWKKGECAAALEGQDLGGVPANYYTFRDYVLKEYSNKCCMAILYFTYTNKEQQEQEKLITINWCPDDAPMKLKMRYSSTYKTVKAKAPSLNGSLEAHDSDDLDYKGVPAKAFKK